MRLGRVVIILFIVIAVVLGGLARPMECSAQGGSTLLEAHFDSDSDGFVYVDDPFGTSQPSYADGSYQSNGGYYSGGLQVFVGGVDDLDSGGMSGGWTYSVYFDTTQTGVMLSLRYRMTTTTYYEFDEYSRVLVTVDGTYYGRGSKNYIDHIGGDGDYTGPETHDTQWHLHSVYLGTLSEGAHTLIIGAFNNHKDSGVEATTVRFDDVLLSSGNPAPATTDAQTLVNRLSLDQFKADLQSVASFGDRCRFMGCVPYTAYNSAQAWVESQLQALGYSTVHFDYAYDGGGGTSLWATKVGTAHPESMYIIMAHLDGAGGGQAADDDGSGVSAVLNVARIFAATDVTTDYSVRFIFFDEEEAGFFGSAAYVELRSALRGIEDPAGSGQYPEPNWLGALAHDVILYDHGVGTAGAEQSPYADLDVEWFDGTVCATESMNLALTWRFYNGTYSANYPANAANYSDNTDDTSFRDYCPAVSIRENRRSVSGEWLNPNYHQPSDIYGNYLEDDFRLGFNAVQATVGMLAELVGAHITPSAVEVLRFEASSQAGHVQVDWETASEADNLGFNLYRAFDPDGPLMQINSELVTSLVPPGSPSGSVYSFEDRGVRRSGSYYYWLESVDIYGTTRLLGPVSAKVTNARLGIAEKS